MAVADRVVVELVARTEKYIADVRRAEGEFSNAMRKTEGAAAEAESGIARSLGGIGSAMRGLIASAAVGGGIAVVLGAGVLVKLADEYNALTNRLRAAGIANEDLAAAQKTVLGISNETFTSVSAVNQLYATLTPLLANLGRSQDDVATATKAIGQAMTLSGASTQTANDAIRQLIQSLQSGVFRGDEFNSVMEALGTQSPLIRAIADEFGVTTDKLREMAAAGELVADRVLTAIIDKAPEIDAAFGNVIPTLANQTQVFSNEMLALAHELDNTTGATNILAGALGGLNSALASAIGFLQKYNAEAGAAREARIKAGQDFAESINKDLGPGNKDPFAPNNILKVRPEDKGEIAQEFNFATDSLKKLRDTAIQTKQTGMFGTVSKGAGPLQSFAGVPTPPGRPAVALGEFEGVLGDDPKGRGGGGRKGRKRGGGSGTRLNEYQRETAAIEERTTKMQIQATTVGQSAGEIAKAKVQEELMNAARKAGIPLTADETAKIEALSQRYGESVTAVEEARKAHEALVQTFEDFRDVTDSGLGSFIKALRDGKSGAEALDAALGSVLDTLLQIVQRRIIEGLFGNGGGSGLGGGLGGLFSSLFGGGGGPTPFTVTGTGGLYASGTRNHPGGLSIVGEKGPELLNIPRGSQIVPNSQMGSWGGGSTVVNIINNSDAQISKRETKTNNGVQLDVVIDKITAQKLTTPGTASSRALRTGYGLSTGLTRR